MAAKKRTEGVPSIELGDLINKSLDSVEEFVVPPQEIEGITEYISTGDKRLDIKIANKPNGGIGSGLITELLGWEGSGKSLMAAHLMANVQKDGGAAVYLDTEFAYISQIDFFTAVGVNTDRLVVRHPSTVEECFEMIEKIIEVYRKSPDSDRKKKVIIVVDSVTALPTKAVKAGDFDKTGFGTDKAMIIGRAMQKLVKTLGSNRVTLVFCSQLRTKIGAMAFGEQWTTSGGKAIGFYSSTRLVMTRIGKIKATDEEGTVIGTQNEVLVHKNRLGPPFAKVKIDVYFDRGIDSDTSVIKYLKDKGIIKGSGWYTFVDSHGEEHKFQKANYKDWCLEQPEAAAEIDQKMCEMMIMPYRTGAVSTEDGTAQVEPETGVGNDLDD
jgi:recombination protein RecA